MAFSVSYVYEILDRYSAPIRKIQDRTKLFARTIEVTKRKVRKLGVTLRKVGDTMSSVGRSMTTGITLVGAAIAGMAIKAAADFEQFEVSFGVMLGNMQKGRSLMQDLATFGQRTPFELTGITKAAKKLLAFGVEGGNVVERLRMLGDVSAGIGVPLADMAHIFGKVKAKGKAMTEEIMQFAERGVPIIDVLANRIKHKFAGNIDKAKAAIFKMAEKGKIKFKDIKRAFEEMTKKGGKFHNMMAKQSGTLGGLFSNLKDAMDMALVRFGKTIVAAFGVKNIVKKLSEKVEELSIRFEKWAKANPALAKLAITIAGIVMALGPVLLILGPITKLMGFLGLSMGGLSVPILLIVAGVALLILAFRRWASTNHPVLKSLKRLWQAVQPLGNIIGFLIDRLGALVSWLFGSTKEAGALAHVFDAIGLVLIPVIAGITALTNLLFGESNENVFAGMMDDLNEFRNGTSMVSQVYDGMVNRVSTWIESVANFFSMVAQSIRDLGQSIKDLVLEELEVQIRGYEAIRDFFGGGPEAANGGLARKTGEKTGDNKSKEAAQKQKVELSGRIGVTASGGAQVEEAGIGLNQGANLATVM